VCFGGNDGLATVIFFLTAAFFLATPFAGYDFFGCGGGGGVEFFGGSDGRTVLWPSLIRFCSGMNSLRDHRRELR